MCFCQRRGGAWARRRELGGARRVRGCCRGAWAGAVRWRCVGVWLARCMQRRTGSCSGVSRRLHSRRQRWSGRRQQRLRRRCWRRQRATRSLRGWSGRLTRARSKRMRPSRSPLYVGCIADETEEVMRAMAAGYAASEAAGGGGGRRRQGMGSCTRGGCRGCQRRSSGGRGVGCARCCGRQRGRRRGMGWW